eukprot:TRINITY_DN2210_c0_g1_i2.p1 TRINITY_DN2210_c0_g1~~TRINITY_DN2210_c0_g1_i2.p1  ORF type:complete len:308 (-),score=33.86 TRINITY_DN2210_c0_g1_i2:87-1010(-)
MYSGKGVPSNKGQPIPTNPFGGPGKATSKIQIVTVGKSDTPAQFPKMSKGKVEPKIYTAAAQKDIQEINSTGMHPTAEGQDQAQPSKNFSQGEIQPGKDKKLGERMAPVEIVVAQESEMSTGKISSCLSCCGIFFCLLLIACAAGYIAISVLYALDLKSKDQFTIRGGKDTIVYDWFIPVLATGGISGLMWMIISSIEIHAYRNNNWGISCKLFVWQFVTFLIFLGGNGYVYSKIYNFTSSLQPLIDRVTKDPFLDDFYRTTVFYSFGVALMVIIAIGHLITSICFCHNAKERIIPEQQNGNIQITY